VEGNEIGVLRGEASSHCFGRHRAFAGQRWGHRGGFAVVSIALLPQTLDWLTVVHNGQGGLRTGVAYSLEDLPLLCVPLIAWAGSIRAARAIPSSSEAQAASAMAELEG